MFRRYLLTGLVAGFLSISSTLYPVKLTDTRGVKEYVESFLFNGVYAAESEIILKDNTTASGLTVKEETANTTIARFRGDGNVGIGTTSPGSKLQITQSIATNAAGLRIVNGSIITYLYGDAGGDVHFDNSGAKLLLNESGGNVGIGTTVPSRKFSVSEAGTPFMSFMDGSTEKWAIGHTTTGAAGFTFFSGDHRVKITEAGNVGIGTTSPDTNLDINGGTGGFYLELERTGTYASRYMIGSNFADFAIFDRQDSDAVRFLIQNDTGNVGIGTTAPSEKLEVSGNIKASGTVSQGSSRELKKNISYISTKEAMKALNGLKPVRFEYKTDNFGEEHLGFIAEDVPELVAEQDRKHLNPMDLTAVFAKVIQEQQKMLQDQKETIDAMKREMEMMKSAMNYGAKGL